MASAVKSKGGAAGGAGSQGLTRMSMERLLEAGTSSVGRQRQHMHDIARLMEMVKLARQSIDANPPAAGDEDLPLKRLILETDKVCYRFQTLDAVSLAAANQVKPFCLELASAMEKHRGEMQDFVAELIALLCRTIHNQEVFSDLLLKAHRDVSVAQRRAAECEEHAREAEAQVAAAQEKAAAQITALENGDVDLVSNYSHQY